MKCDRCGVSVSTSGYELADYAMGEHVDSYACMDRQILNLTSERDGLRAQVDELKASVEILRGADRDNVVMAEKMFAAEARAEAAEATAKRRLTFDELREVNVTRCARWHPPESTPWSAADWSNAMCGEAGELANVVKKIRRHETGAKNVGDPTMEELREMAAAEAADVVIYCDLLGNYLGFDLGKAIADKFNKVSEKFGFPERLGGSSEIGGGV